MATITGEKCRELLLKGKLTRKEIAERLGCTTENVCYHAAALGLTKRRTSDRWEAIQADLDAGFSPAEVAEKHNIGRTSIYQAKTRGVIHFNRRQIEVTNLTETAQRLVQSLAKHGVTITTEIALDVVREWSE